MSKVNYVSYDGAWTEEYTELLLKDIRGLIADMDKPRIVVIPGSWDSCQHVWVDVGFSHSRMVCKLCDIEQQIEEE